MNGLGKKEELFGECVDLFYDKKVQKLNLEAVKVTMKEGESYYGIEFQDWTKKGKSKSLFTLHVKDAIILKSIIDNIIYDIKDMRIDELQDAMEER